MGSEEPHKSWLGPGPEMEAWDTAGGGEPGPGAGRFHTTHTDEKGKSGLLRVGVED